jgi:toxin-antitoxin system PIN domain toxin
LILIDANLLLYAYDRSSPQHQGAKRWLQETLGGDESVRLALVTLLAFLRIGTSPAVFRRPLRAREAIGIVTSWLELPSVGVAEPTDGHWPLVETLARRGQARGALMMDAHLAALAIEHGATLCTTDRDFARFPRLKLRNPLENL